LLDVTINFDIVSKLLVTTKGYNSLKIKNMLFVSGYPYHIIIMIVLHITIIIKSSSLEI
jgi:hypothetical protein